MPDSGLITVKETATILGRPTRTVIRFASEGKLPVAQKLPGLRGAYLFDRSQIEALSGERAS